jgi:hypothetical protein
MIDKEQGAWYQLCIMISWTNLCFLFFVKCHPEISIYFYAYNVIFIFLGSIKPNQESIDFHFQHGYLGLVLALLSIWLTYLDDDSKVCSDNDVSEMRTWHQPFSYSGRDEVHRIISSSVASEDAEHALMYVRSCSLTLQWD